MGVHYGADGAPSYFCRTLRTRRSCQFINGRHIDPLIAKVVLEALAPHELELAVGALEKLAQRASELEGQWRKRIEAARYEADRRHAATTRSSRRIGSSSAPSKASGTSASRSSRRWRRSTSRRERSLRLS